MPFNKRERLKFTHTKKCTGKKIVSRLMRK